MSLLQQWLGCLEGSSQMWWVHQPSSAVAGSSTQCQYAYSTVRVLEASDLPCLQPVSSSHALGHGGWVPAHSRAHSWHPR